MMAKKITSADIRRAMSDRWSAPEYAIMWEVADATGAGARRFADAVVMSLWPSRGLELHGIEIKISRSDWKREAADPRKAEAVAQYCDQWWVYTSPGVVDDISDMPPTWGLREFDGKRWRTLKEAAKTDASPISRPFLASLLRRADDTMRRLINDATQAAWEKEAAEVEQRRKQFHENVKREVERQTARIMRHREKVAEFEAAFGAEILEGWGTDFHALGAASRVLHDCNIGRRGSFDIVAKLRAAADAIEATQGLFPEVHEAEAG